MKVVRFNEAERYEPEADWKRASLCSEPEISIEHFTKPPYHASPKHKHGNAQVLVLLKGRIAIEVTDETEQILNEGDTAYIPGGEEHVVKNLLDTPSIGLDIFVPGRSFDFWLQDERNSVRRTKAEQP